MIRPGGTIPDDMPAHRALQMSRSQVDAHGPITRQNHSSANKRVRSVGSDE